MKKKGDPQSQPSYRGLADMVVSMAEQLSAEKDPRFRRFWDFQPPPVYLDWFRNSKKVNVLVGANKALKTTIGLLKCICVYTGLIPPAIREVWSQAQLIPIDRPRHVRVIVQDYTKHWPETIKSILVDEEEWGLLPEAWARNYDPDEHIFYGPDGSFLSIVAIDPKQSDEDRVSKILRGPLIDHTYIDELTLRAVFTESLTRNATASDGPATVDLGFCPQEGFDWTYHDLYLTNYDRYDHRLPDADQHPTVNLMRVGMKDNPKISSEMIGQYIATLKPWEVAYRVNGCYSERAGDPYFDVEKLDRWRQMGKIKDGIPYRLINKEVDTEEGKFEGQIDVVLGRFDEGRENIWRFWELPGEGEYYLMTCDGGEGHAHGDFCVANIWRCSIEGKVDSQHPVQVAEFRKQLIKPGDFIEECCCMATAWGEILVAMEVTGTAGGTMRDRARMYPNLYRRRTIEREFEDETIYLGWNTDSSNKPSALEQAYNMIQGWTDDDCGLRSPQTLAEMLAFEERIDRDPRTQIARRVFGPARKGLHDDTVTVLWIMAYIVVFQKECLTVSEISGTSSAHQEDSESELEKKAKNAGLKDRTRFLRKAPLLSSLSRRRNAQD